jgi:hypothetical protein
VLPEYALRLLQNKFVLTKILLQLLILLVVYRSKSPKNCEVVIIFKLFEILFPAYNVGMIQPDASVIDNCEFNGVGTLDNFVDDFAYVLNDEWNFLIYTSNKYASDFYDITIGSDQGSVAGNSANLTNYIAGTGYDITTGLGSPNCSNLCNDLLNI